MNEEPQATGERRRINRWLIIALVGAVLAGILLASTIWDNRPEATENVAGNAVAQQEAPDLEKLCAAQATYDAIRGELFRRAAQVRGSDEQAYTRLADFALLRVNSPVVRGIDDQLQSVTCSGSAVLSLPPNVEVAGGRRSLSGDIDYMIQPAADGTGNVVRLGNVDSIVVPLATLTRSNAPENAPLTPPEVENSMNAVAPATEPSQPPPAQPAAPQQASPSFDCDHVGNNAEAAICSDAGLAALDRQMAADFNRGMSIGDARQRRLLERTRSRFLNFRNRCATNQCIEETYQSRIREIGDIMTGRWRG
jgi:hypothetical protein